MKCKLKQSYYVFELNQREMGKLRKLRGIASVIGKITNKKHVRGVMVSQSGIEVNIAAGRDKVEEVVASVKEIISEELI